MSPPTSETEQFRQQTREQIAALWAAVKGLEEWAAVFRREAVNTRRAMREVRKHVAALPTKDEMRALLAEQDAVQADRLRVASSSWPPTAVFVSGLAAALIIGIILVAVGAIHVG